MKKDHPSVVCCNDGCPKNKSTIMGDANPIYGLSVIGALFYFLHGATSFGAIIIGIAKSIFWPAILMFKLLTFLQV